MDTTRISNTNSYLTFCLGNKIFGMNISRVLNIIELSRVSINLNTDGFVIGHLNLRSIDVPVVDTHRRFGLNYNTYSANTCILITSVVCMNSNFQIGILVDSLCEVSVVNDEEIDMREDTLSTLSIVGLAGTYTRVDLGCVYIIDPDTLFSPTEVGIITDSVI